MQLSAVSTASELTVSFQGLQQPAALPGMKGQMRHAVLAKRNLNADRTSPGESAVVPACLPRAASQGDLMAASAASPAAVGALVAAFPALYACALQEVQALHPKPHSLLNSTLGYVYTSPRAGQASGPPLARWAYSMALMASAL